MKRGTLMFPERPQSVLPSFVDCGLHELGFLALLGRALRDVDSGASTNTALGTRVRRYVGDIAAEGKGEILVWQ
jgi:formylmethanofuran dehydrogenase subunit C